MGKVGLCTPTESRIESGMSSHYWILKPTNVDNLELPLLKKCLKCMCKSGKNQTGRERDPLPVWAHTSKKTSKVENKLPYKCSTSSFTSKSCLSQRMDRPGTIIKYIANNIKGRKAYTTYINHTSSQRQFKTGVPQGGIFSPTLFNIYTKSTSSGYSLRR